MYVYIWKNTEQVPFYVGLTKRLGRTNPRNNGGRNWLCRQQLALVGADNVIVEFHTVPTIEEGQLLEKKLIAQYGRIQTSTGALTNLRAGGEGTPAPSLAHREKLRTAMLDPTHPIHSKESRDKAKKRMNEPDVKERFLGENNPAKRPEVRAKIKAAWQDPAFRAARVQAKIGIPIHTKERRAALSALLLAPGNPMREYHKILNTDAKIKVRRIAGIRAAQPKRAEKMTDPIALAQRKARLSATLHSPEYKAKRALWDTPEFRANQAEKKRLWWAAKKASI